MPDKSICNISTLDNEGNNLFIVNFVYETDFPSLNHIFLTTNYQLHIVTKGSALLKDGKTAHKLQTGSIFLSFPLIPYEISDEEDFQYMYITFNGSEAPFIMEKASLSPKNGVLNGYEGLISFWKRSILMVNSINLEILSQSVLLYTLSVICANSALKASVPDTVIKMKSYIDNNFCNKDFSLEMLAKKFFFNKRYASNLLKRHLGINYSNYVKNLRIARACHLLETENLPICQVSAMCGFSDQRYFSKAFYASVMQTPSEYKSKHLK